MSKKITKAIQSMSIRSFRDARMENGTVICDVAVPEVLSGELMKMTGGRAYNLRAVFDPAEKEYHYCLITDRNTIKCDDKIKCPMMDDLMAAYIISCKDPDFPEPKFSERRLPEEKPMSDDLRRAFISESAAAGRWR
ncbi:MAG: hypothetical protein LKJ83_08635 [Eubacteriaceae bacterium]|jgi:hypothetical protein|nr:hypothetical protein [Eubacteriaceae bacterium]